MDNNQEIKAMPRDHDDTSIKLIAIDIFLLYAVYHRALNFFLALTSINSINNATPPTYTSLIAIPGPVDQDLWFENCWVSQIAHNGPMRFPAQ